MSLAITATHDGFTAANGSDVVQAVTLTELVRLLSEAGWHSTDISDAVDAAGLMWPGGLE